MGLLRLLLAISVVIHHAGPLYGWTCVGGFPAVQTFFMISGFYIYMILKEKYIAPKNQGAFYLNRFLRLFPAYWAVLALSIAVSALGWTALPGGSFLHYWKLWWPSLSLSTIAFAVSTNLALFFQDTAMFLAADPASGNLGWTAHFLAETHPIWLLLVVPQAWSLGIELMFYVVAPFLFRLPAKGIAAIAAFSLALRMGLHTQGYVADPWSTRFFPTELVFFCIGALACHFYLTRLKPKTLSPKMGGLALLAVLGLSAFFQFIPFFNYWPDTAWLYYAFVALMLPVLFKTTAHSEWDRRIGEFSYPIYIGHFIVMRMVPHRTPESPGDWTLEVLGWTIVLAWALLRVSRPFERMRARRSSRLSAPVARRRDRDVVAGQQFF